MNHLQLSNLIQHNVNESPEETIKRITSEHEVNLLHIRNQFEIQKMQIMQETECKKLMIESAKADCLLAEVSSARDSVEVSNKRKIDLDASVKSEPIDLSDDDNNSSASAKKFKNLVGRPRRKMTIREYCVNNGIEYTRRTITSITYRLKQLDKYPAQNDSGRNIYSLDLLSKAAKLAL